MSSEEHLHRGVVYVECHMDPNISKPTTDKKRVVASCAESESQSTSRDPNTTRFLTVQSTIRAKMQCDKKTLLAEADASKKRNLTLVGGYTDNTVDLCGEGIFYSSVFAMDKQFCRREMDHGVKRDIWSVMEDFSKG